MPSVYERGISILDKNVHLRSKVRQVIQLWPVRQWWRSRIVSRYLKPQNKLARAWIWKRTENDNFYYDLTEANRADLAHLVSLTTGVSVSEVKGYIAELAMDSEIRNHISNSWQSNPALKDAYVGLGRREGWYAFVRALKPKIVIETGVSHGVGACVIASALLRNREEGFAGQYLGTDWDESAGFLLSERYKEAGRIIYGDSITTLESLDLEVDLFINDSDHSFEYEAREYQVIKSKLSKSAFILGDNSHVSPSLREFADMSGRGFAFFKEVPKDHWYPGAGIGISLPPITRN